MHLALFSLRCHVISLHTKRRITAKQRDFQRGTDARQRRLENSVDFEEWEAAARLPRHPLNKNAASAGR